MKVKDLREAIQNAPDEAEVVFQGNIQGEEDEPGEATYTTVLGTVFSAFARKGIGYSEFVIDGKITAIKVIQ